MSEWRLTTLDQLGRIVTGKTPVSGTPQYFGGDIPFVTPSDFDGHRMITATARHLTEEGANSVGRSRIPAGAVMVSCIGSDMGKAAIPDRESVTNQQINSIIVDAGDDPLFVYYALSVRKAEIRASAGGSAQPILNKSAFGQLGIRLPLVTEQRAIARVLGALDDKIEQNRRTAQKLERLARAIFHAWFVDFEPVKAKAARATSFPSMPQPVFDALPDRFAESNIGEVPEGWEVRSITQVATFLNGLALQKYPPRGNGEDLRVIKIAQLRKGSAEGADLANSDVPQPYVVEDGDLLFSWSGTLEAEFWFGGKGALNQHLFKVTSSQFPAWFCYQWVHRHLPEFRAIAASKATTMGHIQRRHLQEARVIVPPDDVLQAATAQIGSLHDMQAQLALESRHLAGLRDYLLPKLLSGEVRVRTDMEEGDAA